MPFKGSGKYTLFVEKPDQTHMADPNRMFLNTCLEGIFNGIHTFSLIILHIKAQIFNCRKKYGWSGTLTNKQQNGNLDLNLCHGQKHLFYMISAKEKGRTVTLDSETQITLESLEKDNSFILTGILIDNTDVYLSETSLQASQNLKLGLVKWLIKTFLYTFTSI